MSGMPGRRSQSSAAGSRERILDSAARTFAAYGYRKSTFEEIASGAGVSRTLLYSHFDNKLGLLRAVRDRALGEWAESVERAAEEHETARGALEAIVGETLRFARARPLLRAFLSDDSRVALQGEHRSGRLSRDAWRDQTVAILVRGVDAGEFASDLDARATADVLCAMQLGVIEQMHHDADPAVVLGPAHIATACRILVGGVGCGLETRSESVAIA
jgi:AcrR family transcriptional regulator